MTQSKDAVTRLSKAKLLMFKKLLEKMMEEVLEQLQSATIKFMILLDEYRENPGAPADRAQPPYAENKLLAGQTRKLENIHKALHRIESGVYGICMECGGGIEEKRLIARPTASTCADCQNTFDEEAERDRKMMCCRGTIPGKH